MTDEDIKYVVECIKNNIHAFYIWSKWLKVRADVLTLDKNECIDCKAKRIYSKATTVHHINEVKKRPDLALCISFIDTDGTCKRNLVSLCRDCHELRHGRKKDYEKLLTEERWD